MIHSRLFKIFKNGSKTYFYSSLFFPQNVKEDVFKLYSFVRTADDFVDHVPQKKVAFNAFIKEYRRALKGLPSQNLVIAEFIKLQQKYRFPQAWVDAFIAAMTQDLTKHSYRTIAETESYMYGSAEVIGLMMAKILGLPTKSYPYAQKLGKAMQYVNFIRDIHEDIGLQRTYLPVNELRRAQLPSLEKEVVEHHLSEYQNFVQQQLQRYAQWQNEAELGFHYIPKRYLIPIKTASHMYKWTASIIAQQPLVVYQRKVKPSVGQIIAKVLLTTLQESLPFTATKHYPTTKK